MSNDIDVRTNEDKALELELFGYADEFPPIPGSYKETALALARQARECGAPDSDTVEPLKSAIQRMHDQQAVFIAGVVIDNESENN